MDGEDIEARAAVHDATRVTVHYLDVFHAVLFPSCSPQFLFSLYLAGRRLDGVHETRAIYRSRNGTSHGHGKRILEERWCDLPPIMWIWVPLYERRLSQRAIWSHHCNIRVAWSATRTTPS